MQTQTILQNTIEQQNQQILTLNQQLQQFESYRNDSNKNIEELHMEIAQLKEGYDIGQKSLAECQQQLFTTMQELSEKALGFNEVTQLLNNAQQNFDSLEREMLQLRHNFDQKEREYNESFESLKNSRSADIEMHYQELLSAKDLDLQTARAQLQEALQQGHLLAEKLDTETRLKCDIEAKTVQVEEKTVKLEEKFSEQLKLMEEEEKQLEEMRAIIEEQVVKIEELKKELFEKSNDYDSLVAEMDMGRKSLIQTQVAQGVSFKKYMLQNYHHKLSIG